MSQESNPTPASIVARINPDGSVASQNVTIGVNHLSSGAYQITFPEGLFQQPPVVSVTTDTTNFRPDGFYIVCPSVSNVTPQSMHVNLQNNLSDGWVDAGINLLCFAAG